MSCRTFKEHFDDRLDGRLTEPQRAGFDEHVATCADCRREWQAYAGAWEVMQRHTGPDPSFGFVERTLRRLNESPPLLRPWFWRPAFRWAALATVTIGLAVAAWTRYERLVKQRRVEIYASVQQAEPLEDLDVIANLDQFKEGNKL